MTSVSASSPQFVCLRANAAARCRLFCFPYAGGGPSAFAAWANHVPADVELWCVSLPGRGARVVDPPVSEPAVLLQQLLVALVPHLDRPYAFFGHSMGGLLGAELTQRLKQVQYPAPRRLWLSGCTPPHASPAWEPISHLPDEEFLARLGDFGGTPPALLENREFMAMLLPALRADFSFCEKYRGRTLPPLDPPLSIFGGSRDTLAPRAALEGWRSYSRQALDVQIFEGDHFFLGQQTAQVARAVFSRMSEPGFLPA